MTTCRNISNVLNLIAVILLSTPFDASSFAFSRIKPLATPRPIVGDRAINSHESRSVFRFEDFKSKTTPCDSKLFMANDEGPGGSSTSIIAGFLLLIFVAGSVLPFVGTFGMKGEMSIADSVVTRQDSPGKLQNFESKQYSLSRSAIQEKLNAVPVFYIAITENDGSTTMGTDIYMSFDDANAASARISSSSVKGTTLDQVMYVRLICTCAMVLE